MSRISHPLKIRRVLDNRKGLTLRVEGGLTINMSNELTLRANKDFGLLDDTQDIFQLLSLYWWSLTCDVTWRVTRAGPSNSGTGNVNVTIAHATLGEVFMYVRGYLDLHNVSVCVCVLLYFVNIWMKLVRLGADSVHFHIPLEKVAVRNLYKSLCVCIWTHF